MDKKQSRRIFCRDAAILCSAPLWINSILPSSNRPVIELRIRRDVSLPAGAKDLQLYRKAVAVLKQRGRQNPNDPTGWQQLAQIHNQFCPHRNWFFLPWHRAYLHCFEAICRDACGDPSFNLPYWNWTREPKLPKGFLENGNPLNDPTRTLQPDAKIPDEFVGERVINAIMQKNSFQDLASYASDCQRTCSNSGMGMLESTPHNRVHNLVGGNMFYPHSAAQDPLFWVHHANVDRIWANWNEKGRPNPTDAAYNNYVFQQNFCNPQGERLDITCRDLFDTRKMGYRYDIQETPPLLEPFRTSSYALKELALRSSLAKAILNQGVSAKMNLKGMVGFSNELETVAKNVQSPNTIKLICDLELSDEDDRYVRIFLDYPGTVSVDTSISDIHYVGSVSFFGADHEHSHNSTEQANRVKIILDVTDTVRKLAKKSKQAGSFTDLQVQLIAIGNAGKSQAPLLVHNVEIFAAEPTR